MYGRRPEARDWVWKSSRRWPPSGWRVRCSLMPAAMLEIHGAALRVLWGLLEANPLRRCARRRRWAPSTIDYTHHDQKKDRARQPPATLAPSHPKPLHAGNSQAPACGAPASRQRERETSDLACSVCFPRAASNRLPADRRGDSQVGDLPQSRAAGGAGLAAYLYL